ncbi:MAG: hypothetical protein SGILL_003603 [Bacillariaceae sp.]
MSIKARLSATFPSGDASPPFDDDDDDDNDKASKIERTSAKFLMRSVIFMSIFFLAAVTVGQYLDQQTELVARTAVSQKQKQQKQLREDSSASSLKFWENDRQLAESVHRLDQQVRARKATKGIIMETDSEGLKLTKALQQATLSLLKHRYGQDKNYEHFRIRVDVNYPNSIKSETRADYFTIEVAPMDLIPCSVFYFLEIARTYEKGSFHRNAGHVLQAQASSAATKNHKSMPFQEYSPDFPHAKYTTGYAGRPSGPGWYVSIQDNTHNHGPGSQQKANPYEADSLFGKLILQEEDDDGHDNIQVVKTIHSVPQNGWLDAKNHVDIHKLTILVQDEAGKWGPWSLPPPDKSSEHGAMLVMQ